MHSSFSCPLSPDKVDLKAWQRILNTSHIITMLQLKLLAGLLIRKDQPIEGGSMTWDGVDVTILLGNEGPPMNPRVSDPNNPAPPPAPNTPPNTEDES
jgi:hypothetical protein